MNNVILDIYERRVKRAEAKLDHIIRNAIDSGDNYSVENHSSEISDALQIIRNERARLIALEKNVLLELQEQNI